MFSASRVASAPCLYWAGKSGRSTPCTPGFTSKLPEPPTKEQSLHAGFLDPIDNGSGAFELQIVDVGIVPTRIKGANHRSMASNEPSELIRVVDIYVMGMKGSV
jgi:hypothetical protein